MLAFKNTYFKSVELQQVLHILPTKQQVNFLLSRFLIHNKILLWEIVFILETPHIKFCKCPFNLDYVILTEVAASACIGIFFVAQTEF